MPMPVGALNALGLLEFDAVLRSGCYECACDTVADVPSGAVRN